jgi:hypothetical protein
MQAQAKNDVQMQNVRMTRNSTTRFKQTPRLRLDLAPIAATGQDNVFESVFVGGGWSERSHACLQLTTRSSARSWRWCMHTETILTHTIGSTLHQALQEQHGKRSRQCNTFCARFHVVLTRARRDAQAISTGAAHTQARMHCTQCQEENCGCQQVFNMN